MKSVSLSPSMNPLHQKADEGVSAPHGGYGAAETSLIAVGI